MDGATGLEQKIEEDKRKYQEYVTQTRYYEAYAAREPARYRKLVARYAFLGMFFIYATLLLWIAILVGFVWYSVETESVNRLEIYAALVLVPLIYVTLRSLTATSKLPSGLEISRKDAPILWSEVDRIAKACGAPATQKIILDGHFNAAAVQRTNPFAPWKVRNILLLGLPLLSAGSREEVLSVIAHEYGHFSGLHGKFGGKIYRLERVFGELRDHFQQSGNYLVGLYRSFYNWFFPRFSAMTFAMSRQQEYEADAMAARLVGAQPAADFLMKVSSFGRVYGDKFQKFGKRALTEAEPPAGQLVELVKSMEERIPVQELAKDIRAALNIPTDIVDTHPSLSDRLRGLGFEGVDADAEAQRLGTSDFDCAAKQLLGTECDHILMRWATSFCEEGAPGWRKMHRSMVKSAERLNELDAGTHPKTVEEAIERVDLRSDLGLIEKPLAEYQALLPYYPESSELKMRVGYLLLEIDDPAGEELLRQAMGAFPKYAPEFLDAIASFHQRRGALEEAERIRDERFASEALRNVVYEESSSLTMSDAFVEASLSPVDRAKVVRVLEQSPIVFEAFLVGKPSSVLGGKVLNHLLVFRKQLLEVENDQNMELAAAVSDINLPDLEIWSPGLLSKWRKVLVKVPNSRVKGG